ncbi:MAG: DMT family transporter [Victivallales bacterium]|nr:DMT family transporter [Victivallales bacterium]
MNSRQIRGSFLLLLTAVVWGFAFVAQQKGLDDMGAWAFNMSRFLLGSVVLIPVIAVLDLFKGKPLSLWGNLDRAGRYNLLMGGMCCGFFLAMSSALQQIGLMYTTVGKAGFLTALYIVLVPIAGMFLGRRSNWLMLLAVPLALLGAWLLCFKGGFDTVNKGDVLAALCAIGFTCHILTIDHFAPRTDCVRMASFQFFIAGCICGIVTWLVKEPFTWTIVQSALLPILYCGILSSGVGYTCQIVGQRDVHPVIASLLMSLESVFATIGGALFFHDRMTTRETLGCIVLFLGVILAQLPFPKRNG